MRRSTSALLAPALLGASLATVAFGLTLAPTAASACITGEEFFYDINDTYPQDGANNVPIDAAIAVRGTANLGGELHVEVSSIGGIVAGTIENRGSRAFWRPDAPLEPGVEYVAHLWTEDPISSQNVDQLLSFTTVDESAPLLGPPTIALSLSKWDKVYTKCVAPPEPGDCSDCGQEEVTMVEERIRVSVSFEHPGGPFSHFYGAHIRDGASEKEVAEGGSVASEWWSDGSPINVSRDLGLVGSWEGDEVCVRAWIWDPRALESEAVITCAPIGDVNTPTPAADTDSDSDSDSAGTDSDSAGTDSDSAGTDSDSAGETEGATGETDGQGSATGGIDGDDGGCGCRASNNVQGGAAFFLGLLLAWARGRRRRPDARQAA